MTGIYENLFEDADDVFTSFDTPKEDREGVSIIFAEYEYEDYNGSASVIYEKGGKLYEVYGAHCSCYGLEGQWEPEEIEMSVYVDYFQKRGDTKILNAIIEHMASV